MNKHKVNEYILAYIGVNKWNELSVKQQKNLTKYVTDALKGKGMGTFRYLVYDIIGTYYYDMDYMDLNNNLCKFNHGNIKPKYIIIPQKSYGHSIKNKNIIHLKSIYPDFSGEFAYYGYSCCNSYTALKATYDTRKVTCKNCLRVIKKADG
jgi:hypothetical protein